MWRLLFSTLCLILISFTLTTDVWADRDDGDDRHDGDGGQRSTSPSASPNTTTLTYLAASLRARSGEIGRRVHAQIETLRGFSDDPYPAVTRVLFT